MKDETVWLNREQLAKLFDRDVKTIGKHINNVLKDELEKEEVVAKFATTTKHGAIAEKSQRHLIDYYNLDMIISIGYRVKSKNGIIFRKWANKILKDYMIRGYSVNQKRLEYLEKTVKLIDIASRIDSEVDSNETKEIFSVISRYSRTFELLDNYDNTKLKTDNGNFSNVQINYEECISIIFEMKKNEKSKLFALERELGLKSIIENIYQTFDGKELYISIEEKASNFLYMIVKNHIFIDGNKRIGAALFIYFLQFYGLLYKNNKLIIDNNTLTAITLLIAQSSPKEKDIIVELLINFLL